MRSNVRACATRTRCSAPPNAVAHAQLQINAGEIELSRHLRTAAGAVRPPRRRGRLAHRASGGQGTARIAVNLPRLDFANADAAGTLSARWSSAGGPIAHHPGVLELDGRLTRGAAARTARYLPLAIHAEVRDYVGQAVQDGALVGTRFRVKGDLNHFPYADGSAPSRDAEFRIATRVDGLRLAYLPGTPLRGTGPASESGWPAMTQLNAELVFDRASMRIRNGEARIGELRLDRCRPTSPTSNTPGCWCRARRAGPAAPCCASSRQRRSASGPGGRCNAPPSAARSSCGSALDMPLEAIDATTVDGSVLLAGNDVRITPGDAAAGECARPGRFQRQRLSHHRRNGPAARWRRRLRRRHPARRLAALHRHRQHRRRWPAAGRRQRRRPADCRRDQRPDELPGEPGLRTRRSSGIQPHEQPCRAGDRPARAAAQGGRRDPAVAHRERGWSPPAAQRRCAISCGVDLGSLVQAR